MEGKPGFALRNVFLRKQKRYLRAAMIYTGC